MFPFQMPYPTLMHGPRDDKISRHLIDQKEFVEGVAANILIAHPDVSPVVAFEKARALESLIRTHYEGESQAREKQVNRERSKFRQMWSKDTMIVKLAKEYAKSEVKSASFVIRDKLMRELEVAREAFVKTRNLQLIDIPILSEEVDDFIKTVGEWMA